ncbi:MAG: hypothetical protein CR986_05835 [Ignavibacteriae bacterium]|nr:MAG: hypothetical protein CR986_05835 [Ignavibacteriota bacterium]
MKFKKYILILVSLLLIFYACEDRSDLTAPTPPNTGSADFTKFISIGNSLTAGVQNHALYESAQNYSFGKLIANQVGVDYVQPTISDPGIGGKVEVASLEPFLTNIQPVDSGNPTNLKYQGIYNNLGIPGIVLADLDLTTTSPSQFSGRNPFIDIILRGQGKVIDLALTAKPTLITLWIGNNDILGYATSGGLGRYTQTQDFARLFDSLCAKLSQSGANVVIANIPNVTIMPFFTTVSNKLLQDSITAVFGKNSNNSITVMDLKQNLLTLRAQIELAQGKGTSSTNPLSNSVILDSEEIAITQGVIKSYNDNIRIIAKKYNFKLVDINQIFNEIAAKGKEGKTIDGVHVSAVYINGGLFSLDGIHPTSKGYGIIANAFIKVINKEFDAKIPLVNVATLPSGIDFYNNKKMNLNKQKLPIFPEGAFDNDNILY